MKNLALLLFLFSCFPVFGQNREIGIIMGNVLEIETGKAVEDASILLQRNGDSTTGRRSLTDKNGNFEFDKLPTGYYQLVISSIGFTSITIDSIHIRAERYDFNLSDIKMHRSSAQLQEVIVYTEKPLIESKDGVITYNVSESALSSGSSTAEILKNMPLISNDPEGKVLLKGKEPKILIDDKPTDLNAQQLADLLESLPGSSIEKIELMSNPPPQYASEPGGVINIITRKGKVGLVGRVTVSVGSRGESNVAANLSYRQKKWNVNLVAGIARSRFTGTQYSRRQNLYNDSTNWFHTDGAFINKNFRPNLRVQADYEIKRNHVLNAVLQSTINNHDNESDTYYRNINRFNDIYKTSTRANDSKGNNYTGNFSLGYTYKADTTPEKFQVIVAGNVGKSDNDKYFLQRFLLADLSPTGIDSLQQQFFDYQNQSFNLRVNYDKPLWRKGLVISSGTSYITVNNHNILSTLFFSQPLQAYVNKDILSNDFKFGQTIFTARGSVIFRYGNGWRLTAGIQAEHTRNTFTFIKGNVQDVATDYLNWLPNATLRKEFGKEINTALVYRATIRRPGIRELNPNIDYNDPYNIRFGNPALLPTLAHHFDWNVGYTKGRYYINTTVGYNKVTDVFNTIRTLVENGVTEVTYENIANRNEYEGSIWGGYTINKRLRVNASAGYSYNQYGEQEKQLYKYRDGESFFGSLNFNYTPTSLLAFEGSTRYSSFADPQGRARSNLTLNVGVQRKFFSKRLIVSFNIIDPFRVKQMHVFTYGSRFNLESFSSTNTRNFRLSLAYQLNKVQQKKTGKEKKTVSPNIRP